MKLIVMSGLSHALVFLLYPAVQCGSIFWCDVYLSIFLAALLHSFALQSHVTEQSLVFSRADKEV
jgi:hypothetical protein